MSYSMSYTRSRGRGLMGLGAAADDQAPIDVGAVAQNNPIFSSASVMASAVMLKMAAVPKAQRLGEMVKRLNNLQAGLGDASRADFLRRIAQSPANKVDQAMFETLRSAIVGVLVARTLQRGVSGLGQTLAEARGATSQGVNDANAIFCSYVTGTVGMVGGAMDQLGITGTGSGKTATTGTAGALTSSSTTAANTAGCGAGRLVVQGDNALAMARLAQSGVAQTLAMQADREARFMRYALIGGGLLGMLGLGYVLVKKT
jgi:hypothetical protein